MYKKARTEYRGAMDIIAAPQPGVNTGSSSAQRTRLFDKPKFSNGYASSKLDKLNSQFQRWRYNNLGRFSATKTVAFAGNAGAINLQNVYGNYPFMNQNPAHTIQGLRPPMFIYSLTRAPQTTTGLDFNQRAYACYPVINDLNGDVRFVVAGNPYAVPPESGLTEPSLQGVAANATVSSNVQIADTGIYAATPVSTGSNALLHSADITLQLYGQKNKATRYRVMICQFDEDNSPIQDTVVGSATPDLAVGYPTTSDAGMFWVNWIKKLCFNPAHKGVNAKTVGMRVMFERYIYIDPVQNTDNDGSPQVCTYRLQPFFGRLLNYRWSNPSGDPITEAWTNAAGMNSRYAELQCDVEPKARIYLVVTADNYTQTTQTSPGPITTGSDTIPSMEFDINTTWRVSH